jgi:4a-hydroxytetrahydrobiopterin dehydratase
MIASPAMAKDIDGLASNTLGRKTLDPGQIAGEMTALGPRWSLSGSEIQLALKLQPMVKAAEVVAAAAKLADEMDHHPKIVLEYAGITLTINTHDANGITMMDLVFAARLERWLRDKGL